MESNRIADYFLVIGCPFDSLEPLPPHEQTFVTSDPLKLVFTPQILDRYPMEDRDDVSLPTGLTLFCLPDGLHVHSSQKPPSFYSFVQTSESGAQLIGCCLTFFEELNELQRKCFNDLIDNSESSDISSSALSHLKLYVPKCLCLLSHWPFVASFKKYLCHLYRLSLTPCRIPIERYICNFLDDVPAPPPGLVEVSYFIGTECVVFKRPPSNEPNAWSTMPMTPLFECLSPENIISLFSLLLAERQIVLLSSQYSLLTSCSECMLSLLYPCQWTHVYIPILPRRLLGVLAAPLPFVVGVHTSFLPQPTSPDARPQSINSASTRSSIYAPTCFDGYAVFSSETVRVYLDDNRIEVGSLGPPPRLPDGRYKKLMNDLKVMAPAFRMRMPNWRVNHLPYYDSAFEMSVRPDLADGSIQSKDKVDEKGVRGSFLKFMVTMLKNYRQYLIYPTPAEPYPMKKFREEDYIADHPSDWTPILTVLLQSQAFYQFVEVRVSYSGWSDHEIVFFDESIEAKINRLTFRLHRRDTPFLLDNSFKHTKTFVAPTVDMDGLEFMVDEEYSQSDPDHESSFEITHNTQTYVVDKNGVRIYHYQNFPRLNPRLYRKSSSTAQQASNKGRPKPLTKSSSTYGRLKRANVLRLTHVPFAEANVSSSPTDPVACIFSTFLIIFSRVVSTGLSPPVIRRAPPTLAQVLNTLNLARPAVMGDDGVTDGAISTSDIDMTWSSPVLGDIELPGKVTGTTGTVESTEGGTTDGSLTSATLTRSSFAGDEGGTVAGIINPKKAMRAESYGQNPRSSFSMSSQVPMPFAQFGENKDLSFSADFLDINNDVREEYLMIARSAIETAFELFEVMRTRGFVADEEVFRSLADACAVCGAGNRVVEVLEAMTEQGMLPDVQICSASSRALSFSAKSEDLNRGNIENAMLAVTPKDVSDAAESRDFSKLRTSYRKNRASSDTLLTVGEEGYTVSSFKRSMKKFSLSTDSMFSNKAASSPVHGNRRAAASRSGEEFCSVTTIGADATGASVGTNFATVASPRFTTQVTLADRTLDMLYSDLIIDLVNTNGTSCPNLSCRKGLKIFEIIDNFSTDANKYTVKCPHCSREFVPRFTVHSKNDDWVGSTGVGSVLWCELLSPWVLQKELLNDIDTMGIESIVSSDFRNGSINPQSSVVFWNMMVYFRLYGLPYAFLITEKLSMAFLIPLDD